MVVKLPLIEPECGSQSKVYVLPAPRATSSQTTVPTKVTVVEWLTPGPVRRKLWNSDSSRISMS